MALRLIFAGTPAFAATHLEALIHSEHEIVAVYTQPDRPAGRGKKLQASEVKQCAQAHDLPVYQPLNFKDPADIDALAALNADVMIVVAYGLLLPIGVLEAPKHGCLNVHGSLLPRWRGAAPIQRAIEAGDEETGITIMQMNQGLDTGDMLRKVATPITDDDTGASLHDRLAELGPPALLATLADLEAKTLAPEVQDDEQANYAHKLLKPEAQLNWTHSAVELARRVRAFNPFPVAFTSYGDQRIRVWAAHAIDETSHQPLGCIVNASKAGLDVNTRDGVLRLTQIQMPGKKSMSVSDVLNGQADAFVVGDVLGDDVSRGTSC